MMAGGPFTIGERELITTDWDNQFNTKLSKKDEEEYNKKFKPEDSHDYDMRGWFKENKDVEHTGPVENKSQHYPDKFKKPNHPTFSDESMYHGKNGYSGGHWSQTEALQAFQPGPTNLKYRTSEQLKDYFNKVEPGVNLILPDAE